MSGKRKGLENKWVNAYEASTSFSSRPDGDNTLSSHSELSHQVGVEVDRF